MSRFQAFHGNFDVGDRLKIRSRNGDDIYDEIIEFSTQRSIPDTNLITRQHVPPKYKTIKSIPEQKTNNI